jgi:hypothetical protein
MEEVLTTATISRFEFLNDRLIHTLPHPSSSSPQSQQLAYQNPTSHALISMDDLVLIHPHPCATSAASPCIQATFPFRSCTTEVRLHRRAHASEDFRRRMSITAPASYMQLSDRCPRSFTNHTNDTKRNKSRRKANRDKMTDKT